MTTQTLGRQLIDVAPDERWRLYLGTRPNSLSTYETVVGRLLGSVLRGERVVSLERRLRPDGSFDASPLVVGGLEVDERKMLDSRFPLPEPSQPGRPPTRGIGRWALDLPQAVRSGARFAQTWADGGGRNWVRLDDGAGMLVVVVVGPIVEDLSAVFRIRRGEGPQTLPGRRKAIDRCLETHLTLGLDGSAVEQLLDPALSEEDVRRLRHDLVAGWAAHPDDIGTRALSLLCTDVASRYYAKARKDGTVPRQRVLTATVVPLLQATLETWEDVVEFLGERLADVDAAPIQVDSAELPKTPPPAVAERLVVIRQWWHALDLLQRGRSLHDIDGLDVARQLWQADGSDGDDTTASWSSWLPDDTSEAIDRLWGTTVVRRHPSAVVKEFRPQIAFFRLIDHAVTFWEYVERIVRQRARYGAESFASQRRPEYVKSAMAALRTSGFNPDDVWNDVEGLNVLLEEFADNDSDVGVGTSIVFHDDGVVEQTNRSGADFEELRDAYSRARRVVDRHRRAWIENELDGLLDRRWRSDLDTAGQKYRDLHVGRGKPPTPKQAAPLLDDAAKAWFGGDISALAAALALEGRFSDALPDRSHDLPADVTCLAEKLTDDFFVASSYETWQAEALPSQVSGLVCQMIQTWQATGEWPKRSEAFDGREWLLLKDGQSEDLDATFEEFLEAFRRATDECRVGGSNTAATSAHDGLTNYTQGATPT